MRRRLAVAALLLGAIALAGCLTERPPDEVRGQLFRVGPRYRMTACGTDDSFELRLATALQVNLERRVSTVEQGGGGPVLAEIGGRILPPTRETAPTKILDVWKIGAVSAGTCH